MSTVSRLQTGHSVLRIPARTRVISSPKIQSGSGAHPASCSMGTTNSFPGVKRPGHEADHLPSSYAKVTKEWSYSSTPPVFLHRKTSPSQLYLLLEGIMLISTLPMVTRPYKP